MNLPLFSTSWKRLEAIGILRYINMWHYYYYTKKNSFREKWNVIRVSVFPNFYCSCLNGQVVIKTYVAPWCIAQIFCKNCNVMRIYLWSTIVHGVETALVEVVVASVQPEDTVPLPHHPPPCSGRRCTASQSRSGTPERKKRKKSLMGFVYWVLWILKALWLVLSETINILICKKKKLGSPPPPPPENFIIGLCT